MPKTWEVEHSLQPPNTIHHCHFQTSLLSPLTLSHNPRQFYYSCSLIFALLRCMFSPRIQHIHQQAVRITCSGQSTCVILQCGKKSSPKRTTNCWTKSNSTWRTKNNPPSHTNKEVKVSNNSAITISAISGVSISSICCLWQRTQKIA